MIQASTIAVDLTLREVTQSFPVSVRESVALTLTSVGASVNSNMRAVLLRKDTICATCETFTGSGTFAGTLDLNTEEMVDVFDGAKPYAQRRFDVFVYDASGTGFLVKRAVDIENSELRDDDTFPGNVTPISAATTVWGNLRLRNGILYLYSADDGKWYPFTGGGSGETVHIDLDGGGGWDP